MAIVSDFGDYLLRCAHRRRVTAKTLADWVELTPQGLKHHLQAKGGEDSEKRFLTYLCVWIDRLGLSEDESRHLRMLAYLSRADPATRRWMADLLELFSLSEVVAAEQAQALAGCLERLHGRRAAG